MEIEVSRQCRMSFAPFCDCSEIEMFAPDLIKAAERLEETHPDIAGAIRDIRDINSIRVDLTHAFNFAQSMNAMSDEAQESQADSTLERAHHAFLLGAIVLYARAMKTQSDHRKTFNFRSRFTDDERSTHELICSLRDDAVAHYGPGHQIGRAGMHKDGLFLAPSREAEGALRLMSLSQRIILNRQFGGRLLEHLRRVNLLVQKDFEERETKLISKLNQLVDDEQVQAALRSSKTDLAEYMSSSELAQIVLDGYQVGPLIAVSNH